MFKRPHHQRIAQVLLSLDGSLFREHSCLIGGGTVIALVFGEYRVSKDIDFLVSDVACYRRLRQLLTQSEGVNALLRQEAAPLSQVRDIRADQYGIRTILGVAGTQIKFEIVLEGRMQLNLPGPGDEICGIPTLARIDMAAGKLLANSDRWADDGVFSRDLIDLAMMRPSLSLLRQAVEKAEKAYGTSILADLGKAIEQLRTRQGRLERCMQVMEIDLPKAVLWQRIRALKRVFKVSNHSPAK